MRTLIQARDTFISVFTLVLVTTSLITVSAFTTIASFTVYTFTMKLVTIMIASGAFIEVNAIWAMKK